MEFGNEIKKLVGLIEMLTVSIIELTGEWKVIEKEIKKERNVKTTKWLVEVREISTHS